jgi:hypothetical protein
MRGRKRHRKKAWKKRRAQASADSLAEFLRYCWERPGVPRKLQRPPRYHRQLVEFLASGGPTFPDRRGGRGWGRRLPLVPGVRYVCPREVLEQRRAEAERAGFVLVEIASPSSSAASFEVKPNRGEA